MSDFTTTLAESGLLREIFEAITNVRGWWSQEVSGVTDQIGGNFKCHYKDVHRYSIRVTELMTSREVAWLAPDSHFNFIEDQPD